MTGSGMAKLKGLFKATVSNLFFLINKQHEKRNLSERNGGEKLS